MRPVLCKIEDGEDDLWGQSEPLLEHHLGDNDVHGRWFVDVSWAVWST